MLRRALPSRWRGRAAIIAKTPGEFEAEFPAYYLDLAADGRILHDSGGDLPHPPPPLPPRARGAGLRRPPPRPGGGWAWGAPPRGPRRRPWGGAGRAGVRP